MLFQVIYHIKNALVKNPQYLIANYDAFIKKYA